MLTLTRAVCAMGQGVCGGVVRSLSRDIGQPSHYTHPELLEKDEVMPGVHKMEFAERRTKLMEQIATTNTGMTQDKHVVIIPGAPMKYMSADVPYRFHQNTDMLYLTGYKEPDSVLVMEADTNSAPFPDHKAILYVRPRDPNRELWDGPRAGPDGAVEFTGVDESYSLEDLPDHLEKKYGVDGYCVWYGSEEPVPHPQHAELITEALTRSPNSKIKDVHNPSLSIARLRVVKSASELGLMRRAGELAGQAFSAAMSGSCSGVSEAKLETIFEHFIKTNGAQWLAFPPVVAGGNRANHLHYIANNRHVSDGELVLMDAGCEYHGYVSDVTRTWPVNGVFSAPQRDLYEAVRTTKQELIELCRSGVTLNYLHSTANEILASQLKKIGVIPHHLGSSQLAQVMGRLFPHHVGHYLGMDTHDAMLIDRNSILKPGVVITIEPGLYIPQEFSSTPAAKALAGTGIRLEDNVLVTEGEAEILNRGCPETFEELAQLIPH